MGGPEWENNHPLFFKMFLFKGDSHLKFLMFLQVRHKGAFGANLAV
jgi:hypothetical protein